MLWRKRGLVEGGCKERTGLRKRRCVRLGSGPVGSQPPGGIWTQSLRRHRSVDAQPAPVGCGCFAGMDGGALTGCRVRSRPHGRSVSPTHRGISGEERDSPCVRIRGGTFDLTVPASTLEERYGRHLFCRYLSMAPGEHSHLRNGDWRYRNSVMGLFPSSDERAQVVREQNERVVCAVEGGS